jgi:mono/diheme cytochrome c family protein
MRSIMIGTGLALATAVALAVSPAADAKDEPDVAAMFQQRCANCHAVPDPALRTDRAWLDQVNRTA